MPLAYERHEFIKHGFGSLLGGGIVVLLVFTNVLLA